MKLSFSSSTSLIFDNIHILNISLYQSIVGSVVECSPATRAARVRFPDDANITFWSIIISFFGNFAFAFT
jgi:hypothetical protein